MNRHYSLLTAAIFLLAILSATADPLDQWTWRNPVPTGNRLSSVTYGDGRFVAVGDMGTVITSTDGIQWTSQVSGATNLLWGTAYGHGLFVAVGGGGPDIGPIITSTNAANWTLVTNEVLVQFLGVTYANGHFLAPAAASGVMLGFSTDGLNWTNVGVFPPASMHAVAYGNNLYVGVADTILTSRDLLDWSGSAFSPSQTLYDIAYATGLFVAVGTLGTVVTSNDGLTWMAQNANTSWNLRGITYGQGLFVAVGENGTIVSSSDGVNWTNSSYQGSDFLRAVTYGNGTFVAVGDGGTILTSLDSVDWTKRNSTITGLRLGVIMSVNDRFVASAWSPSLQQRAIIESSDGITWTNGSTALPMAVFDICYGAGLFVGVGGGEDFRGGIATSPDGLRWTALTGLPEAGSYSPISHVAYGNGVFVAGNFGDLISTNGVDWRSEPPVFNFTSLSFAAGRFIGGGVPLSGGGGGPMIVSSANGVTWTTNWTGSVGQSILSITYGNGVFVAVGRLPGGYIAGGQSSSVLTSTDGTKWLLRQTGILAPALPQYNSVAYGSGSFVAVGYYGNNIMSSSDGVHWSPRFTPINGVTTAPNLFGVAYGDGTFVAVGDQAIILQSGNVTPEARVTGGFLGADGFHLQVTGQPGQLYRIQAATNLFETSWTDLATITNGLSYLDTSATGVSQRFYRASPQ